jgi:hypothetical protein
MTDTPSTPDASTSPFAAKRDLRDSLRQALATGYIDLHNGVLPFLWLDEQQRVVMYAGFVEAVKNVPGVIVEVGVGRGDSLLTMARQEVLLLPNDMNTSVFGFDSGQGFLEISDHDGGPDPTVDRVRGGYGSPPDLLQRAIDIFEAQRGTRGRRIELILGDALQTIPEFVERYNRHGHDPSSLAIKLLHLDCDLYEPTRTALEHFGPLLTPGALVILDEWNWGRNAFPGEARAIQEYFAGHPPYIERGPWRQPGGWFRVTRELATYMRQHH